MTTLNELIFDAARDRRLSARTRCHRGALFCIPKVKNLFSFTVRNISRRGLGMRLHTSCRLLPIDFVIVDEGVWTVRRCRLIWRQGDFAGAEFTNQRYQDFAA
jgi:hypothetical protein